MDSLIIQLDVSNKKANFTASKAVGAYTSISIKAYNFGSTPDEPTLRAVLYSDSGTALSVCGAFTENGTTAGLYEATLSLATDTAISFFSLKAPSFQQDLTLVISDTNNLYCNSKLTVKNNPNAIPGSPIPVTIEFVQKADLGWTFDLGSASEIRDITDQATASQVRRALITLVSDLQSRGVI
jgi:hypothetical protein